MSMNSVAPFKAILFLLARFLQGARAGIPNACLRESMIAKCEKKTDFRTQTQKFQDHGHAPIATKIHPVQRLFAQGDTCSSGTPERGRSCLGMWSQCR